MRVRKINTGVKQLVRKSSEVKGKDVMGEREQEKGDYEGKTANVCTCIKVRGKTR